ncbi:MAG TPA: tryptophan 2,3-dioxygenase family protein [Gemmatimonadota bacterium]|nr:tryptophan 2,3-dioxygenase family protein [Gemmatimonadota bacterium]
MSDERSAEDPRGSEKPFTYASYLALDELLSLQRPESDEHDEILFIVIHQVYELWFKELLHEADWLAERLAEGDTGAAMHTLKRILTILKIAVAQLDILETMTPRDFLSFRDRLASASGFQSAQFRELEFALGHKRRSMLEHFPAGTEWRRRLEARWGAPTVWDALLGYLAARGYPVPEAALGRDVTGSIVPDEGVQRAVLAVYRRDDLAAHLDSQLLERFVDLDEGLQEWRYRHVKMVQRTIGGRKGTGGSAGASYLKTTLDQPFFPDLWAIRTEL